VLRERTQDLRDLGYRLLQNMTGLKIGPEDYRGRIIIARELMPSDIFKLAAQGASGIIMLRGSATSHASILGSSLGLPLVTAEEERLLDLQPGTEVLLDASQGTVFVEPDRDIRSRYQEQEAARSRALDSENKVKPQTHTRDGTRIRLMANINLCSDLPVAKRLRAEGVGLYRSEFPFIIRNEFPTEEEQFRVYRRVLEEMEDRPVVFRTLDIGGDKMLSYATTSEGSNPFMGLRSIRFSLQNQNLFSLQLRAMLRAAHDRPARIMFPLVGSLDDFVASRDLIRRCQDQLQRRGTPHCSDELLLGITVELPSAVELIDEMAREADFLSIGTNDLVQYLLAVDRTNPEMQDLYRSHHPAVLRAIERIVRAAQKHETPLSVCGEAAADTSMLPFLIGLGIRELSLDPRHIPRIQSFIETLDAEDARDNARQLLRASRIEEVEELLAASQD
jgi:phosphotransferase system enzyme I (PtsP)